jgi:hypothetical protein
MIRTKAATALPIVLAAVLVVGCSSSSKKSGATPPVKTTPNTAGSSGGATTPAPSASSSVSAALASLLIAPSDIKADTFTLADTKPISQDGATGVVATFSNADSSRQVGDTIIVFPSEDAAKTAVGGSRSALGSAVPGGKTADLAVASDGVTVTGTVGDKAECIAIFREGADVVTLAFVSAASDPVPVQVLSDVASTQDAKIKAAN